MKKVSLKNKLPPYSWFIFINILIGIVISSRYFYYLPEWPSGLLAPLFIASSVMSQMAVFGFLFFLVCTPILMLRQQNIRQYLLASIASVMLVLLIIDTFVFAQYRFHINKVVVDILIADGAGTFSIVSWIIVVGSFLLLLSLQVILLKYLEKKKVNRKSNKKKYLVLFFFSCFAFTQIIHIWSSANAYSPVMVTKRYLPLFYPFTANHLMEKLNLVDKKALAQQRKLKQSRKSDLNYPLHPLQTKLVTKPFNIIVIAIDSWRGDTFNKLNTPNLWDIAKINDAMVLKNHISSGNSTRTGVFGLFYGLPGTYWHSALANQTTPLLMARLKELDYSMGIFMSAKVTHPEFDQTTFRNVDNLREGSKGGSPALRDIDLTQDWLNWHDKQDKERPTFSFLFYDAPHGYSFPEEYQHKFLPMLDDVNYLALNNETDPKPFMNRYKTSVHFVDSLIKSVIEKLKTSGELKNTIVIITGDHGQELNDNKLNYWGHNSNFTAAQTHVPFIMFGPGISNEASKFNGDIFTSHVDVVPTLMKNYLGIKSPLKDYSTGVDLLGERVNRPWILSSSYSKYSIITKESMIEVDALGNYQLLDKTNRALKEQSPNFTYLKDALSQLSQFNK